MTEFKTLLEKIQLINEKYKKLDEINATRFNIFTIIGNSSDEVNLHSKFIAELLNPDGSHGQGNIFLKLFIKTIQSDSNFTIETEDVQVFREKENIDIFIKSYPKAIIIENKIYTEDHSDQLSRYIEGVKRSTRIAESDILLIYLTLFGSEPNEKKVLDKVVNISYQQHICQWLELCIKEAALIPTLRESLLQYLRLIKELTHQSQNKNNIMEIKDFLLKGNNLQAAIAIEPAIFESKVEIQVRFWEKLQSSLKSKGRDFDFVTNFYNPIPDLRKKVTNFYTKSSRNKIFGLRRILCKTSGFELSLCIQLEKDIFYGFSVSKNGTRRAYCQDTNIKSFSPEIHKLSSWDLTNDAWNSEWWICIKRPNKVLDFDQFNSEAIFELLDPIKMQATVNSIVADIDQIITAFEQSKQSEQPLSHLCQQSSALNEGQSDLEPVNDREEPNTIAD